MTRSVIFLIMVVVVISVQAQNQNSTYYLIRHAEKIVTENEDPDLKVQGQIRAEKWADLFKHISFDAIYSTNYMRTRATALPTAVSQNLNIIIYDHEEIDYEQLLEDTAGKTVLIVGHSNTTPQIVNIFIGRDKYELIDHHNNGNLYIVDITENHILDKLLYIE